MTIFYLAMLLLCLFQYSVNFLTKEDLRYSQQLTSLCKQNNLTIFNHTLAKTQNNNEIYVLGISSDNTKKWYIDFVKSPAILITGVMHPRQDTSFRFIKQAISHIIKQYSKNNVQIVYLLERVVILIIPFVNIDAVKYTFQLTKQSQILDMRKNLNYDKSQNCKKVFNRGVDINRNFDYNYGKIKTSLDPCGEEYRGNGPFSQSESQAIKKLFDQFNIINNIDVHSYGNLWIYPYASDTNPDQVKYHKLYPFYEQIFKQFDRNKIQYYNCYQSLKYVADGVYIDWALYRNSLSFALEFGDDFNIVGKQMNKHIVALLIILRINVNSFQLYFTVYSQINKQKQKVDNQEEKFLCIKSLSTLQHNVILIIDGDVIQGQRLKSKSRVCFKHNFNIQQKESQDNQDKAINLKSKKIQVKIGKSKIFLNVIPEMVNTVSSQSKQQIFEQLKENLIKEQTKNQQSLIFKLYSQFKILIISVAVLYFIGSLCGLSIFCQNALGMTVRTQQQASQFTEQQSTEIQDTSMTLQSQQDNIRKENQNIGSNKNISL